MSFDQEFERFGGAEALRGIVQEFYHRMAEDILVGFFFKGKDLERIITMQTSFLLMAMGLSDNYEGKMPQHAHPQMHMQAGHLDRRYKLLAELLNEKNVPEAVQEKWLKIEHSFRDRIILSSNLLLRG